MKVEVPLLNQTRDLLYSIEPTTKNLDMISCFMVRSPRVSPFLSARNHVYAAASYSAIGKSTNISYFEQLVKRQLNRNT